MTTTQAPEKTPNAFQRGVNAVIDLLSSFFLPIINLLVSVGILKGILTLLQVSAWSPTTRPRMQSSTRWPTRCSTSSRCSRLHLVKALRC
ncbi:MAG: hypothetical protein ACLU0O_12825 [Collinsella sp.]